MQTVFVLQHEFDNAGCDEVFLIGVYSSHEAATAAQTRVANQPGFRDHPDGFSIDEYLLDRDHWTQGFITEDGDAAEQQPITR